jgi:hypothetical protein
MDVQSADSNLLEFADLHFRNQIDRERLTGKNQQVRVPCLEIPVEGKGD